MDFLTIVPQQEGIGDCFIACLSTYLGVPYVKVLAQAVRIHDYVIRNGLSTRNICRVARALGKPLTATGRYNIDEDCGILEIIGDSHVVILFNGSIIDLRLPTVSTIEAYFASDLVRPGKLLVRKK